MKLIANLIIMSNSNLDTSSLSASRYFCYKQMYLWSKTKYSGQGILAQYELGLCIPKREETNSFRKLTDFIPSEYLYVYMVIELADSK